jgi:hypothetical protein
MLILMPLRADERRTASPPSKIIDSAVWNLCLAHMLLLVSVTVIKYKNRKEQSRIEDVWAYAEVSSEPQRARC